MAEGLHKLHGLRNWQRLAGWVGLVGWVLASALLTGCPDNVQPPKTPPGPSSPDAPRVPTPKAGAQADQADALPGKTALTVVPPFGRDCTLKNPPSDSTL